MDPSLENIAYDADEESEVSSDRYDMFTKPLNQAFDPREIIENLNIDQLTKQLELIYFFDPGNTIGGLDKIMIIMNHLKETDKTQPEFRKIEEIVFHKLSVALRQRINRLNIERIKRIGFHFSSQRSGSIDRYGDRQSPPKYTPPQICFNKRFASLK